MGTNKRIAELVGQQVAGFELTELLGEGGMAAVFRGENLLDRTILRAIKVVHPQLLLDEQFAQRFAEEARLLERLQHPNVVRFHGARWEGDVLLMELELLQGAPLSRILHQRAGRLLPLERVVGWMRQAAAGLAAAHQLGVVHRDLKPDNLFLTDDGELKLLDFGIARALDEADRANALTRSGTVPGTPAYLAPEVCQRGELSKSSDVYALGICFIELLLGHHPLMPPGAPRRSSTELMFAQVQEQLPPLRRHRGEAPPALEAIVERATCKDPELRFAHAGELLQALEQLETADREATTEPVTVELEADLPPSVSHEPPPQDTPDVAAGAVERDRPPAPRRVQPWVPLAVVTVALVAASIYLLQTTEPPAHEPAATATPEDQQPDNAPAATPPPPGPGGRHNVWILIKAPTETMRLGITPKLYQAGDLDRVVGFRPGAAVHAPKRSFEIQQHEVTWRELDPWLARQSKHQFDRPAGVPEHDSAREHLPVTGVPWAAARAYCKSLGGDLPTEEQWELAARGAERRPHSWGSSPLDRGRTHAYKGKSAQVRPVMRADQDRTPASTVGPVHDLMGNAREWTLDLYRGDETGAVAAWAHTLTRNFRAIRGLPLDRPPPPVLPREAAAHRDALCAQGDCPKDVVAARRLVGFRCARVVAQPK